MVAFVHCAHVFAHNLLEEHAMAITVSDILHRLREDNVKFLRLQFTDILGANKNVEVPTSQFEKAVNGEIMFDGYSVQGFTRIEESDMLLKPDLNTYLKLPPVIEGHERGGVARLICDVKLPDGTPFMGDPRWVLRRQIERVREAGFDDVFVGTEPEFYLFLRNADGTSTTTTNDRAGYFDLAPVDRGEDSRRRMVNALVEMGFEIEAAHHEASPGQHEIDFRFGDALKTADAIQTFRTVVKRIALQYDLHATFMPKPVQGIAGSGMHTHLSLFTNGVNVFDAPDEEHGLSQTALYWTGGLLHHAAAYVAVTNPTVNSYKRLASGYEAPINIAWSISNRSAMIRVPAKRGLSTRTEVRMPDPSANPYLALSVMIAAGLDGIARQVSPPPPIRRNIYEMTVRERRRHQVKELPRTLGDAIAKLEKNPVLMDALVPHVSEKFIEAKTREYSEYLLA